MGIATLCHSSNDANFKHWVNKKKNSLMNKPGRGLIDVLIVPNENAKVSFFFYLFNALRKLIGKSYMIMMRKKEFLGIIFIITRVSY